MLRNIGSNWGVTLASIGSTFVLTPLIIHGLGQQNYGTWTLITAMTGYLSLLTLGVPMACVRYVAQHTAARDTRRMNQTIGTCAVLYLVAGLASLVIGGALMAWFARYPIPADVRFDAYVAFGLMAISVSAGFIGLLPEGIMFAHHDFVPRNLVRLGGVMLRLGLTAGWLAMQASLVVLATIHMLCLAFDFLASWWLIRRRYPAVRITPADFDWSTLRRILAFSLYVLLLTAGARLTFETSALIIAGFQDVATIPYYTVANSLIVYLMDFVVAIAAVVSPMATKLTTEDRRDQLKEMFLKWSKVALSLAIGSGLFLMVLGPRFIGWWIDPSYEHPSGQVLQILMLSAFVFLPARGVALPLLMGLGKPKGPTLAFLASGVLSVGLSLALVRPFGLAGVAAGTAITNVLFALVVTVMACRETGVRVRDYIGYVVPRAALGALPVLALLIWFRAGLQVRGLLGLTAAGAATVALFGITWIAFVYRRDPYVNLQPHLVRIRTWNKV